MAADTFDIHQLAAYLHMTPEKVQRMVERGRIPGRKIQGQWRFNEAEIHAWLEDRIGASEDAEELDQLQTIVDRWRNSSEAPPGISELLRPEAIEIPLQARTRGSVIRRMCALAEQTGLLWDAERMVRAVQAREELMSTALDIGVALLHPRRPMASILGEPLLALGVTPQPIPFGNIAGNLTDVFFLICSTDDRVHLQVLAKLSRLLTGTGLVADLRKAETAQDAYRTVTEHERSLDEQSK